MPYRSPVCVHIGLMLVERNIINGSTCEASSQALRTFYGRI